MYGKLSQALCAFAMDWDDLKIFLHVARTGAVLAASRRLDLDHSTVSRRVARLEGELETKLFERAGRRLRITESGQRLQAAAQAIESIVLQKVESLASPETELMGSVRIGVPEGLGIGYLGRQIGQIRNRFPAISPELVALPRSYSLASREVDIAVTLDRPRIGNVTTRKLTDYTLLLYGTARYQERSGWPAAPADLSQHRLCGYIPDLLQSKELDYLRFGDVVLEPHFKSSSIIAQAEMIASGDALGILPCFVAAKYPHLTPILPAAIALRRSYWISSHEDHRHTTRIKVVRETLLELVRNDRLLFLGTDLPARQDRRRTAFPRRRKTSL